MKREKLVSHINKRSNLKSRIKVLKHKAKKTDLAEDCMTHNKK